jgi:hypothetical protein
MFRIHIETGSETVFLLSVGADTKPDRRLINTNTSTYTHHGSRSLGHITHDITVKKQMN